MLRYRVHAQELDSTSVRRQDAAIFDLGVQDTGPDGFGWALANRGAQVPTDDLALAWTLRGAPHAYRRDEIAAVAAATAPWSEADAAKRIFDAAKPLKAAGIPVLEALDRVATTMRDIAAKPVAKGEMSSELTRRLGDPYLRWCNPCQADPQLRADVPAERAAGRSRARARDLAAGAAPDQGVARTGKAGA